MGLFLTNGFPEPAATVPLLHAIDRGGADFIELGMPFSDPLAEGLPIQRSSARALGHGVQLPDAFASVRAFRDGDADHAGSNTPVLLMGYVNPIFRYGVERFCQEAAAAGADGLILPDLPLEETRLVARAAADAGLALVQLIAPNTPPDRVEAIDRAASGFVYAVSVTGLTGSALDAQEAVVDYLRRARAQVARNPLLVGFGIRSHDDAARLSAPVDGFIVGSALINRVEAVWDDDALGSAARLDAVARFAYTLKHGEAADAETADAETAAAG